MRRAVALHKLKSFRAGLPEGTPWGVASYLWEIIDSTILSMRYGETGRHNDDMVLVRSEDFQKKLTTVGLTHELLHEFELKGELSIPANYWTAFCCASDFAVDMSDFLGEMCGIVKPLSGGGRS